MTALAPNDGAWTIFSPIVKPIVFATQTNPAYTDFDSDWNVLEKAPRTMSDTNLTVRQYVFLRFLCIAAYPVLWFKDNDVVVAEDDESIQGPDTARQLFLLTISPFLDVQAPSWWKNSSQWNAGSSRRNRSSSQYASILWFYNVSASAEGTYSCAEPRFGRYFSPMTTVVHLYVDNVTTSDEDLEKTTKILQTLFSEMLVTIFMPNATFSFVYSVAANSTNFKLYFVLPNGETIEPSQLRNGIWMEDKSLTGTVRKASLIVQQTAREHSGIYEFIIETRSENGSILSRDKTFFNLDFLQDWNGEFANRDFNNNNLFHSYLLPGQMYEMQFSLTTTERKTFLLDEAEIQIFVLSPTDCRYQRVKADAAFVQCGIVGVSADDYKIRLVVKTARPCKIKVKFPDNRNVEPSELDFALVDEQLQSLRHNPIIRPLRRSAYDGDFVLTNEPLTLRCSVPVCDWSQILWCKLRSNTECGPSWLHFAKGVDDEFGDYERSHDPTINVTYRSLDSNTDALDMTFLAPSTNHSGQYFCGVKRSWLKLPVSHSLSFGTEYPLNVENPVAPKFVDEKENQTQKEFMEENKSKSLSCKVQGVPQPNISWWRYTRDERLSLNQYSDTLLIVEPGDYECLAENDFGHTYRKFLVRYNEKISLTSIAVAIPVAVVMISLAIGLWLWLKRRANAKLFKELARLLKESPDTVQLDNEKPLNYQADVLQYNQNYEIDRGLFDLTKLLGKGEFGMVFKGILKHNSIDDKGYSVAVKIPKDPGNIQQHNDLLAEFKIMSYIRQHVNVISLIGACTSNIENKQLFVLTEYCENGSLDDYLIEHWNNFDLSSLNGDSAEACEESLFNINPLLDYAYQAANGMKHLASENIIHRDLALRNLLLTREQIVKISDFGMSRQHSETKIYRKHVSPNEKIPIWWMALESCTSGQYTQKSDVWSFGVVLWEMFTCEFPYKFEELDSFAKLVAWLKRGHRLSKPKIVSQAIYDLMLDCWKENEDSRPTFSQCKRRLGQLLEERSPSMYATVGQKLSSWQNLSPFQVTAATATSSSDESSDNETDGSKTSENPLALLVINGLVDPDVIPTGYVGKDDATTSC